MSARLPELVLFAGRSNFKLAKAIESYDGLELSGIKFTDFANGEHKVSLKKSVRGEDVFIIQTASPPNPDKWMIELFLLAHTAKRASARRITAVIPYIYGSRQDRKSEPRSPITIQLMADLMRTSGIDRVLTVSLHNQASVSAFGDILVDNLTSSFVFAPILEPLFKEENFAVMSPDAGGVPRAKSYANRFGTSLGFAYKMRPEANESRIIGFAEPEGGVEGKNILIVDDIIDTAGTLIGICEKLKEKGAKDIYVSATHAILSDDRDGISAVDKIVDSKSITKLFITDSIEHENLPDIFQVVSLGNLFGDAILRINGDESVGALWEKNNS